MSVIVEIGLSSKDILNTNYYNVLLKKKYKNEESIMRKKKSKGGKGEHRLRFSRFRACKNKTENR